MTDDGVITNRMLLEHQQAMELRLNKRIDGVEQRLEKKMDRGFSETTIRLEAIEEDLQATIQMQSTHQKKIAVLAGEQLPDEY